MNFYNELYLDFHLENSSPTKNIFLTQTRDALIRTEDTKQSINNFNDFIGEKKCFSFCSDQNVFFGHLTTTYFEINILCISKMINSSLHINEKGEFNQRIRIYAPENLYLCEDIFFTSINDRGKPFRKTVMSGRNSSSPLRHVSSVAM